MLPFPPQVAHMADQEEVMLQRLATLLSTAALVATVGCAQSDPGVTTAVKSKLATDDGVKAYQIDVDTRDRVVTLRGTVDTVGEKERALMLARQTRGVQEVVDQITVSPPAAATTGITEQGRELGQELREQAREATEKAQEIGRESQQKAGEAANRTADVLTDAGVTTAVKSRFLADTSVSGLKIDVDTQDGVVTLNGTVTTKAEADRAVTLAGETSGVKRVVSHLHIGH
jgi:osmotically-inducible protein OsmY